MKKMKDFLLSLAFATGAWRLYRAWINKRQGNPVRILSAHRVIDASANLTEVDCADLKRGCLSKASFEKAITHLAKNYTFIGLDRYAEALQLGHPPPDNALMLTFDDGYRDVFTHAYPILEELDIPFTVFLTTGWIGTEPFVMTDADIRALAQNELVSWGAHGVTHRVLTELSLHEGKREITESLQEVERLTGSTSRLFCYPDGKCNLPLRDYLASSGVLAACSTGRSLNSGRIDRLALQRIPFEEEALSRFSLRVAGRT